MQHSSPKLKSVLVWKSVRQLRKQPHWVNWYWSKPFWLGQCKDSCAFIIILIIRLKETKSKTQNNPKIVCFTLCGILFPLYKCNCMFSVKRGWYNLSSRSVYSMGQPAEFYSNSIRLHTPKPDFVLVNVLTYILIKLMLNKNVAGKLPTLVYKYR